jgi:DedD protein
MRHLLDEEDEQQEQAERELTLSTGAILGIFVGLVLLCGAFFGFGYKMGSHKTSAPIEAAITTGDPASTTNFNAFKPAAGSPAGGSSSAVAANIAASKAAAAAAAAPAPVAQAADVPAAPPEAAPIVHNATPAAVRTPAPASMVPTAVPVGTFLVQVAAISHKEDADLMVNALKAKGYPAAAYPEPDKLLHIQVGPYATRKDAEAARQRLVADGYQPIVK